MECVAVFTGKSLQSMRDEGGSGHWHARPRRVERAQYLVCVRNSREQWAATDHKHGTAFLVAKISHTSPAPHDGRIVIGFSEYAEINVPGAWKKLTDGQRYPVAYQRGEDVFEALGVSPEKLDWKPFEHQVTGGEAAMGPSAKSPLIEAKELLANRLGIDVAAIEITIRT